LDIQSSGPHTFRNGIITIRTVVIYPHYVTHKGKEKTKIREKIFYFPLGESRTWCSRTRKEAWSEQYISFCEKQQNPSIEIAIRKFHKFLTRLDRMHHDLAIITDNSAFDCGFINHYFDAYMPELRRSPLFFRCGKANRYREIIDIDSFALGVLSQRTTPMIPTQWGSLLDDRVLYGKSRLSLLEKLKILSSRSL
jgi:hypothetical protein